VVYWLAGSVGEWIPAVFGAGAVAVLCSSGSKGPKVKRAFYVFYPAHIAVSAGIWFVFVR